MKRIIALLLLALLLAGCGGTHDAATLGRVIQLAQAAVTATAAAPIAEPTDAPEPISDRCATCGTNSLVGGWESDEGGALILNDDGTYLSLFGNEAWEGVWYNQGDYICFTPTDGEEDCRRYWQNVDILQIISGIGVTRYIRR